MFPRLRPYLYCLLVFLALTAGVELAMGRVLLSKSHRVLLWVGDVNGAENSQQVLDWYSFSHLIHGFLFYGALYLVVRRWPVTTRFAAAMLVECGWEIVENTPWVIERYRATTASVEYYGDSVLNSMCDVCCCAIGFALARRQPWWVTLAVAVALEVLSAWAIRDNLTLNVLMLVWPVEAVRRWQQGG